MKKNEWALVIIPLLATIFVDQITKAYALELRQVHYFGVLGFQLQFNKGAMLGMFSGISPILRIVSLSTGGAFLLFTYVMIQYLLPVKSWLLRGGLSMLMGGIIGNVIDRSLLGHVVDFVFVQYGTFNSPVMNVADILQWFGYFGVVIALIKDGDLIWPENNVRNMYWVNPKYQIRYCLTLIFVGLGYAGIAGVFSLTFLKFVIQDYLPRGHDIYGTILLPFAMTFSIFTACFATFLFLIAKKLSHRTAGPVYAFERFLNEYMQGKKTRLKLRNGDEFLHLEALALKVQEHLTTKDSTSLEIETTSTEISAPINQQIDSPVNSPLDPQTTPLVGTDLPHQLISLPNSLPTQPLEVVSADSFENFEKTSIIENPINDFSEDVPVLAYGQGNQLFESIGSQKVS